MKPRSEPDWSSACFVSDQPHRVVYSARIGQVFPWKWLWTAHVHQGPYEGEASGTALTEKRAERDLDAWLRSMGVEP